MVGDIAVEPVPIVLEAGDVAGDFLTVIDADEVDAVFCVPAFLLDAAQRSEDSKSALTDGGDGGLLDRRRSAAFESHVSDGVIFDADLVPHALGEIAGDRFDLVRHEL